VDRALPSAITERSNRQLATSITAIHGYAKAVLAKSAGIPRSLSEAKASAEWPRWKETMDAEMEKILGNQTYDLVDRSESKGKAIPLQWVFDYKVDSDGNVIKYKAQIVA